MDFRMNITQQLEAYSCFLEGNPLASLVAVKGVRGLAEAAGKPAFSGEDGLALDKAFGALGWGFGSRDTRMWLGIMLFVDNRTSLDPEDLRMICETVDPLCIVALDDKARISCIKAFAPTGAGSMAGFALGSEVWILGRHLVSVDGFEASLGSEASKQRVWAQLKRCVPPSI